MKYNLKFENTDSNTKSLDEYISECPKEIVEKSLLALKNNLDNVIVQQIRDEYKKDPETWWAMYHHGWGTSIRNGLRTEVCLDDKLPSGNWDDYYIQVVEIFCGLRKYNQ